MVHSYIAYIDESGDDGLDKFRQIGISGGASIWLNISASVVRASRDLEVVRWRDEIVLATSKTNKKDVHFKDMNHSQRVASTKILAEKQFRLIHVVSNKPSIPKGVYVDRNQLYFYMCRYLIERISWLCRDLRPRVPEGDGRVKVVFSRRGKMSYEDFRKYLLHLKNGHEETSVHWPVIDIDGIDAQDHSRRAGLQIADIGASAFSAGLEMDKYGNCESRYAEALRHLVYNRNDNYFSYGLKIVPDLKHLTLNQEQQRLIGLFKKT
jgi:hypothetical protein